MSMEDYIRRAVRRFYLNTQNGLVEMLKDKTITEDMTVKELLVLLDFDIKRLDK